MELPAEMIDWILGRIYAGDSQADVARSMAIDPSTLSKAITALRCSDKSADQAFARAREASAEVWLDRGGDVLMQALPKSSPIDASAARAFEQHCARQAAIRNPQFGDKAHLIVANPPGETFKVSAISPEEAAAIYKQTMG